MSANPLALVVEDSDDQARLLRHYLERDGFDVVVAASAEEALALLPRVSPMLAIVDLLLPGMSGTEFAARLRTDRPGCILAISSVLDVSRYPTADDVLPKPFTGAQLHALTAKVPR
ncbi:MAG TPA: response regulator [Lacisediminihabitans sp.]|uniref:response regulator transcription factor n=1 Tax=Lacisediminihabitans sp. TaxID=2787631 RepID=UPI002EDB326D